MKEVQVAMALIEIPGCTALMRDTGKSSRFNEQTEDCYTNYVSSVKIESYVVP